MSDFAESTAGAGRVPGSGASTDAGAARILIVEDDRLNMILMCDLLELHGYRVLKAITGGEAIAVARRERPNLIVMDIGLPNMDGIATLRALRADPSTADIPVVAVSSFAMRGDKDEFISAGFDGYLSKPIDTRRFPLYVAEFLAKKGS